MSRMVSFALAFLLLVVVSLATSCRQRDESNRWLSTPVEDIGRSFTFAGEPARTNGLTAQERSGKRLYLYYCSKCHGTEGAGDGFNAFNLDPRPADLARAVTPENYTNESLAAFISTGGKANDRSGLMPPWGRTLKESQIEDIVVFLRLLNKQQATLDEIPSE